MRLLRPRRPSHFTCSLLFRRASVRAPQPQEETLMNKAAASIFLCLALLAIVACSVQKYRAAPLSPSQSEARLERRSLSDPGLRNFLDSNSSIPPDSWPLKSWNFASLTLAALYFNPAIEIAQAQAATAAAGMLTAAARPNPTFSLQPGIPSPYLLGLNLSFPIQTAGKRGYQIIEAQNLSQSARFSLADSAWKVRSNLRAALLEYLSALQNLKHARAQSTIQSSRVQFLETRLAVGEIARPQVDLEQLRLAHFRLATLAAQAQVAQSRAALAASIGLPVSALDGLDFSWPRIEHPPSPTSLPPSSLRRDAVLNRFDVREALSNYAASEAALQLAIARQYPDLQIGPGYAYEESNSYFTLGLSLALPILNRNQGPIAQAEARRRQMAASFLAAQAQAIAQSDAASARYSSAWKQWLAAKALVNRQSLQARMARVTFDAGESGPLPLNSQLLESSLASSTESAALFRVQAALGDLENAVQRPLGPGGLPLLGPQSPALQDHPKEIK